MSTKFNALMALAVMMLLCVGAMAQSSGSNSPYSRYGIGLLADESMGFNKGMAGLALGMRSPNIINRQNPASYSQIDSLTFIFDAGISLQNCRFKTGGSTLNAQNSSVDYLSAAFRMKRGLGFSVGMRPYSTVGYDFSSTEEMPDIDGYGGKTTTSTYLGEGGVHQLYAGVGWQPLAQLSVGANINYLWGDYKHNSAVSYSESTIQTLNRYYKGSISALTFDFGVQYAQRIGKKDRLIVGATYGLGQKANQRATFINMQSSASSTSSADTSRVDKAFELPSSFGLGFTWCHANQWTFGFDYSLQLWKNCRFPELRYNGVSSVYSVGKTSFMDRHKFVAGVEFIPNPRSLKVRHHICYRAGVAYMTPYTKINGRDGAKSYIISAGVGLPIVNIYSGRSSLNISAQWEHSDSDALHAIKEDYLRLCVGITFNADWFDKWKVK